MATKFEDIRNVVFCGHSSSGKTTLVDKLLVRTGAVGGHPSVDDGTSICDFDPEEKHHKHTIDASLVHFSHNGKYFQVFDSPGYPDFIGQTLGAMRGVETAVIVINAQAGIQVNARRVFREAGNAGLGRILVLNRLDGDNIDFPKLIHSIHELWGSACVLFNVPIGLGHDFKGVVSTLHPAGDVTGAVLNPQDIRDPLIESIIEVDEAVMERYFEGTPPTDEELSRLTIQAVATGTLIPILCCSGKSEVGLKELLDGLAECCLPPAAVRRIGTMDGQEIEIAPDPAGQLAAQVVRTRMDPFVQKLSFLRIYSGTLKKDAAVPATSARKGVKIGQLFRVQGAETTPIDSAGPGEIVAAAKIEEFHTGTDVGEIHMPSIKFPTPMVGRAISPKTRGDETKLSGALHKIVEEDPTFRLDRDAQTKELVATGMSELHLGVIQERLHRRDKLDVETKDPKIPYRETIRVPAEGMYRHKKQSGGRGQFGEVHIRMRPLPRGVKLEEYITKATFPQHKSHHFDPINNFLWVDSIVGGSIPGNFMPAIEKGFKERMARGVIAGHQVQDVCVEVHFGKYHDVDSSEAAFKTAGSMAFRDVFQQAKPTLLEPVVHMAITVPEANVGDVYSDMSTRRGRVHGSDAAGGGMQTVHVEVPLAEVMTYARSLSSMTGGQGSFTTEFSHYDTVPANVQHDILAKVKMADEEDE